VQANAHKGRFAIQFGRTADCRPESIKPNKGNQRLTKVIFFSAYQGFAHGPSPSTRINFKIFTSGFTGFLLFFYRCKSLDMNYLQIFTVFEGYFFQTLYSISFFRVFRVFRGLLCELPVATVEPS
jgi:hypothetical protein